MQITLLKSKIHRATVTDANLHYEGSVSIDPTLCDLAHLRENEQVDIYNCASGSRLTTYVIYGKEGEICLNGPAARHCQQGDQVVICCYASMSEEEANDHTPKLVFVNDKNKMQEMKLKEKN